MFWDLSQISLDLVFRFLDSDPEDECRQRKEFGPESSRSPHPSSHLSLSFEDFLAGEAAPVGSGNIPLDAEDGQEDVGV